MGLPLAAAAARSQEGSAPRGPDVERELELLVPGPAPVEESEEMPQVSHMFSRTLDAAFDKKKLREATKKRPRLFHPLLI